MVFIIAVVMGCLSYGLYAFGQRADDAEGYKILSIITGSVACLALVFSVPLAFTAEVKPLKDLQTAVQASDPEFANVKLECGVALPTLKGTIPIQFSYKNATFQVPYDLNDFSESWGSLCAINIQQPAQDIVNKLKVIQREVRTDIQATLAGQAAPFEKSRSNPKYYQYLAKVDLTLKSAENSGAVYELAQGTAKEETYRIQEKTNTGYVPVAVPKFNKAQTPLTAETQSQAQRLLLQNISGQ